MKRARQFQVLAAIALVGIAAAFGGWRFVRAVPVTMHEVGQGSVVVRVVGPGTVQGQQFQTVAPASTTSYSVTVTDALGCSGVESVEVQLLMQRQPRQPFSGQDQRPEVP